MTGQETEGEEGDIEQEDGDQEAEGRHLAALQHLAALEAEEHGHEETSEDTNTGEDSENSHPGDWPPAEAVYNYIVNTMTLVTSSILVITYHHNTTGINCPGHIS